MPPKYPIKFDRVVQNKCRFVWLRPAALGCVHIYFFRHMNEQNEVSNQNVEMKSRRSAVYGSQEYYIQTAEVVYKVNEWQTWGF